MRSLTNLNTPCNGAATKVSTVGRTDVGERLRLRFATHHFHTCSLFTTYDLKDAIQGKFPSELGHVGSVYCSIFDGERRLEEDTDLSLLTTGETRSSALIVRLHSPGS